MSKYINADILRKEILEHKQSLQPGYERQNATVQVLAIVDRQPAAKVLDADSIEKDLREYAEQKFKNGEVGLANGILKAVGRIKALSEAEVQK